LKKKNKAWLELVEQSTKDTERAVTAEKKKYRTFVNPNNKEKLTAAAKKKLNMSTEEEVEAIVNEVKIPLEEWKTTFENKSPEQVMLIQKELQKEKEELRRERAELIESKKN